jgi:hypothetical protein
MRRKMRQEEKEETKQLSRKEQNHAAMVSKETGNHMAELCSVNCVY